MPGVTVPVVVVAVLAKVVLVVLFKTHPCGAQLYVLCVASTYVVSPLAAAVVAFVFL